MLQAPWMALCPSLALNIAVFGINMLGDALRDVLDPKLRGGLGSKEEESEIASVVSRRHLYYGRP